MISHYFLQRRNSFGGNSRNSDVFFRQYFNSINWGQYFNSSNLWYGCHISYVFNLKS
jgi:hypothetical protein